MQCTKVKLEIDIVEETTLQNLLYPCRLLLAAVIHRTKLDLTKKGHRDKALSWIESDKDAESLQSFAWFCKAMKFDPDKIREGILKP